MTSKLVSCLMGSLLVVVTLCTVTADFDISPDIPVLPTSPGIRYRPSEPQPAATLEIFIDLNCPDSLAQWEILKPVQVHFGTDKLDLVVQQMPLPYHRNAFLCTKGMYVIDNSPASNSLFAYIEESMTMWRNFSTVNTVNMSETEVLEMLAEMANRVTGINRTLFTSTINLYEAATRAAWKFASKRGVAVTPAFFLNGVELGIGNAQPTFNDWVTFLDPIVNS